MSNIHPVDELQSLLSEQKKLNSKIKKLKEKIVKETNR